MNSDAFTRLDAELGRRGKSWAWLGDQIGYSAGRIGNWKRRGVPASAFAKIADALGESLDWVAGVAAPDSDDERRVSPMALRLAQEFDTIIDDRRRLDVFTACVRLIARDAGQ